MTEKVKYISLKEAADYSGYSQDYLSLRARQNKLKAVKIARNWVTSKEWIDDYLKKVEKIKKRKRPKGYKSAPIKETKKIVSKPKESREAIDKKLLVILLLILLLFLAGTLALDYLGESSSLSDNALDQSLARLGDNIFLGFNATQQLFLKGCVRLGNLVSETSRLLLENIARVRID